MGAEGTEGGALTAREVEYWRREFPALADTIHVANCSHSPQSRRVRAALDGYLDGWRDRIMDWEAWMAEVEGVRAAFARLIGARSEEVAISTSASAATASIASALTPDGSRRRVITTDAEFPTVAHVWLAHRRHGFEVEFVPLRDGGWIEPRDYDTRLDERTLLVSATHVYYQNGFRQDLRPIADRVHDVGALLFVDAYQSLGTRRVDVRESGVDILVGGALKYLLGIPGIAFIYVRDALIERLRPTLTGWFGRADPFAFEPRVLDYAPDARRLETGTPPVFAAAAARAGLEIIEEVGTPRIEKRLRDLSRHALQAARARDLEVAGPEAVERRGGITAIRLPDPPTVERRLRQRGIVASARGDVIRVAPHFFNTTEELDGAMEAIAAHA